MRGAHRDGLSTGLVLARASIPRRGKARPRRAAMAPPVRRRLGSRIEAQLAENTYSWQKLGEKQRGFRHDLVMKDRI